MTISAVLGSKGSDVLTIGADSPIAEAVSILALRRIGALPVLDGDRLEGIISERDVIYRLQEHGREILDWPVRRAMTSPAITVDRTTPVLSALAQMTKRRIRHLPVVERGQVVGIVSIGDLVKFRMERIEAEAEAMRQYIQTA